jgi:hypothetical protein
MSSIEQRHVTESQNRFGVKERREMLLNRQNSVDDELQRLKSITIGRRCTCF